MRDDEDEGKGAADGGHVHRARRLVQHSVAQSGRCLFEFRHRDQTHVAAARCRFGIFRIARRQVAEGRAGLEALHQHSHLGRGLFRRGRIVSGSVRQLRIADRRDDELRDVVRLFRHVELAAVGVEEVRHRLIGDGDLGSDFLLDDLLRQHFAAQPVPHVLRRQIASRQLLLERIVAEVLLGVRERCVEIALGDIEFQSNSLRHQNLLDDEVIEYPQLCGEGLLIRKRLRLVARPAKHLVDVGAGDGLTVDRRPGVSGNSGCGRGSGSGSAARADDCGGERHQNYEDAAIAAAETEPFMKHSSRAYCWIGRQNNS